MNIFKILRSKELSEAQKVKAAKKIIKEQGRIVVNKRDYNGKLPLHYAAELGSLKLAYIFKSCGTDLNAIDGSGKVPLHYATLSKNTLIVDVLAYNNGFDENCERVKTNLNTNIPSTATGKTALHMACEKGDLAMASSLKLLGTSLASRDYYGRTPYDLVPESSKEYFTQFSNNNQLPNAFWGSSTATEAFSKPCPVVEAAALPYRVNPGNLAVDYYFGSRSLYNKTTNSEKRKRKPNAFGK